MMNRAGLGMIMLAASVGWGTAQAAEIYVGARGGIGIGEPGSQGLQQDLNNGNAQQNISPEPNATVDFDETVGAGGGFVGVRFGRMAIELGYIGFEEQDIMVGGTTTTPTNLRNAVVRLDVPNMGEAITLGYNLTLPMTRNFDGRIKMGAAFWEHEFSVIQNGAVVGRVEDDGVDAFAGVGIWFTGLRFANIGMDFEFMNLDDDTVVLFTGGLEFNTGLTF